MTITEYADAINRQLEIRYYPNQNHRFSALFEGGEIGGGGVLTTMYGNGQTPDEALQNYAADIKGKTLIFGAMTDKRMEFRVPGSLIWRNER